MKHTTTDSGSRTTKIVTDQIFYSKPYSNICNMETTREALLAMRVGEMKDIVFSNGVLNSTKEMCRNSDVEWEVNSFTEGWITAYMTLEEAVDYVEGRKGFDDFEWE